MTDANDPIDNDSLDGFLDWFRVVVVGKLGGLDTAEATRVATPSGLTLLGTVKHLTWVEEGWFQEHFAGRVTDSRIDNPTSFVLEPTDTVESVVAAYEAECARSRQVVAEAPSLGARAAESHPIFGYVTLRWIMIHMIEETARHAGHLDILREQTDGRTGD